MKTSEITAGETYRTKDGLQFVAVRKCEWKTGTWEGAESTGNRAEWIGSEWIPAAVHSSQIVGVEHVLVAAEVEAERARVAAKAQADLAHHLAQRELELEWEEELDVLRAAFGPDLRIRNERRWGSDDIQTSVRLPWMDYSQLAPLVVGMTRILGKTPGGLARSTAFVQVLAEHAAGLECTPTGHTESMELENADEIKAAVAWIRGSDAE